MRLCVGLIGALALASCVSSQQPGPQNGFSASFEASLAGGDIAAASAAAIQDGQLVWNTGFGIADARSHRMADEHTLFHVASVSKTVTACVILQVVEQGLLRLDEDVNAYLPFAVRHPDFPDRPVTLQQLLTHSSSLRDNWDIFDETTVLDADFPMSLADSLASYFVAGSDFYDAKDNFESWGPGDESEYSNIGTALAAYAAECVTQTLFEDLAEERIFRPLGMQRTSFRLARLNLDELAVPHRNKSEAIGHHGYMDFPAGTMRTSALELSLFLRCIMNGGALGDTRILEQATVDLMLSIQSEELDPYQGLIWYQVDVEGTNHWGHNGGDPGVTTNMWFERESKDGFILLLTGNPSQEEEEAAMALLHSFSPVALPQ